MSRATVVTLLPYAFERGITGHNPASYSFPAVKNGDFECVTIEDGTSWLYVLDGKNVMRRHLAIDEAREMIDTYISANLFVSAEAQPGLFVVEGEHDKESIEENFSEMLEETRKKQNNWFLNLIKQADDVWQKHRLHREISDPQKLAAIALNQKREWLVDPIVGNQFEDCKYCGTTIKANFPICPNCKGQLRESDYQLAGA